MSDKRISELTLVTTFTGADKIIINQAGATKRISAADFLIDQLVLGETSSSAYRGDRGKIAYDHTLATHAPIDAQKNSDITKNEIELKLLGEITSHTHPWNPAYLGETSDTAFRGDHGALAYAHSQADHAPSNAQPCNEITKEEIEAKLTGEITSHSHESSGGGGGGMVFITDIQPNGGGNVGDKTYVTGSDDKVLSSCSADDMSLRVYVIAFIGESNLRPSVTVNGESVGNWDYTAYEDDNRVLFKGYADITLVGSTVTATHEDGATAEATVSADTAPVISSAVFTGGYPGSQTEVKEGDSFDINVVADIAFTKVEVENSGACQYQSTTVSSGTDKTITATIADRGDTAVARAARVRVQKASGTWSDWVYTSDFGSTDGIHTVSCNNLYPSVETINQGSITYPASQEAIKDSESVTVHCTCSDYDTITYSSPNSQLTIPNTTTYLEDKASVARSTGDYNVSTDNYRVSCNRAANDATTTKNACVYIAHTACTLTVTEPASRLRSGGNDGTSAQNHTITITANQRLIQAPTLGIGSEGTWQGGAFTGSGTTWTRSLQVHDDDTKGTYAWGSIEGINLAGKTTSTITGDGNYTLGGFVSRTLTLSAYANEVEMNVEATTWANVAMTWAVKSLPNKRAVSTTATPDAGAWTIDALNTNPTTIVILDTAATGASSTPTSVTIEETA